MMRNEMEEVKQPGYFLIQDNKMGQFGLRTPPSRVKLDFLSFSLTAWSGKDSVWKD